MQKMTPLGGQRGRGVPKSVGGERTLTGREPRVSMLVKPEAEGPKGRRRGEVVSDSKTDVPWEFILVLMTRGPMLNFGCGEDIV